MQKNMNYQDTFLSKSRRTGTLVTVFLMNGFQIRGIVLPPLQNPHFPPFYCLTAIYPQIQ